MTATFAFRLAILFLTTSVLGWGVDTALRSARRGHFTPIRRVPFSPLYGLASLGLWSMPARVASMSWLGQFLVFGLGICAFEWVAGELIHKAQGVRMWDYTDRHLHLRGHTDVFHFFLWGALGLVAFRWVLPPVAMSLGLPGRLH